MMFDMFHFVSQNTFHVGLKHLNIKAFFVSFISYEEIENFAKQPLVYNKSSIILFALSTTDASREAR